MTTGQTTPGSRGLQVYADVLADPDARRFSIAGTLARLPLSMSNLGIVLLVSIETGSFGRAGLVAACATAATAVAAPLWGRMMDRAGQARVLVLTALLYAGGSITVIGTVLAGLPLWSTVAAGIVGGSGAPISGTCVRARWAHRFGTDQRRLDTAYAYEAVMDEVVFIVGPVLATFLATAVHPALGLAAAGAAGLVGSLALAAQRGTEPPRAGRHPTSTVRRRPIAVGALAPIVLACAALGALFGGMEVVIVGFATEAGILRFAGVLAMAWAVGSLLAGVITGTIDWRAPATRRFKISALALACSIIPLVLIDQPVIISGLLLVSGLAIAPTLIASVAVTQAAVPDGRLTEALGWTQLGLAAGVALGAAALGRVVDSYGAQGGFAGVAVTGGLLVLAALTVRRPG